MAQSPASDRIETLYSAQTVSARVDGLAREIGSCGLVDAVAIAVLKGSFVFFADLIRALDAHGVQLEIDFILLASYGGGTVGGPVELLRDIDTEVTGRDVIIVDDILDSGRTLRFAKERFCAKGARSVRSCVLLDKKARRTEAVASDFVGFDCPDRFVVGYGMDFANRYRELPFIGVLEKDV